MVLRGLRLAYLRHKNIAHHLSTLYRELQYHSLSSSNESNDAIGLFTYRPKGSLKRGLLLR